MSREIKIVSSVIAIVIAVVGLGLLLMQAEPTPPLPPEKAANAEEALARTTPHVRGKLDSTVTVIEFADMECPACAGVNSKLNQLVEEYGDRVKFIFRHFPLSQHQYALEAAMIVEASSRQNKTWLTIDYLYEHQKEWVNGSGPLDYVLEDNRLQNILGLEDSKFMSAMEDRDGEALSRIKQDKADGEALGNPGTPTFYVNGEQVFNGGLAEVKQKIDKALGTAQ